jgi:hypothetical protein
MLMGGVNGSGRVRVCPRSGLWSPSVDCGGEGGLASLGLLILFELLALQLRVTLGAEVANKCVNLAQSDTRCVGFSSLIC